MADTATQTSVPVYDRLLQAAERVVTRHGVRNMTLEAVANEAGVSKGGLLYHFPSKSSLITGIVERLTRQCETEQAQAVEKDAQHEGSFTRAYLTVRAQSLDEAEEQLHAAILAAAGTDPHYLDPYRQRLVEWQSRLEQDGLDSATATIVRLAMDGLCLSRLLGLAIPDGELRQQVLDKLTAMTHRDPEPQDKK